MQAELIAGTNATYRAQHGDEALADQEGECPAKHSANWSGDEAASSIAPRLGSLAKSRQAAKSGA
jgi:hypothetical protein